MHSLVRFTITSALASVILAGAIGYVIGAQGRRTFDAEQRADLLRLCSDGLPYRDMRTGLLGCMGGPRSTWSAGLHK